MSDKKRIKYIDIMKGLGIMMVTYGHITTVGNPVDIWMGSFKITIFFVAAGYLIRYTNSYEKIDLVTYVKKLLKSLAIPYVFFSVGAIIFRFLTMVMKHNVNISTIKSYIWATLTLRGVSTLWFLPTLLIGEIIFFCVIKYFPKWLKVLIFIGLPILSYYISCLLLNLRGNLNPITFERVSFVILPIAKPLVAVWFLYIGYIGCELLDRIPNGIIRLFIGIVLSVGNMICAQWNVGVDYNNMAIGEKPWLFFICGIIGSFGALLIFQFLEDYIKFELLAYFGKNSLILMATQRLFYIIAVGTAGWKVVSGMPGVLSWRYYIDCLGILALVLMLEYTIITFINEKARFLIGKF